jgi:phage protein D
VGLMEDSSNFSSLSKKYDNFRVPAAKLRVGGRNILDIKGVSLDNLQIRLSLNGAGSASFTMNDCYDYKNSTFLKELKSAAVLGKTVEAELGYGSSTVLVFKGFLAAVDMALDVEDGISFVMTAMDARRLMMTDNQHSVMYTEKKYSDIAKKILKRYEPLCSAKVEATSGELENPIQQELSDYEFLTGKLARQDGMEFFVVADKAYFRKKKSNKTPAITLGIESGLKSFKRRAVYLDRKIQVQGYSANPGERILGEADAKSGEKQEKALHEAGLTVVKMADISTAQAAGNAAKSLAEALADESMQAEGTCVGLPQIVPGRFIKIEGIDSMADKKYYVTEVSHTLGGNGFTTSFEINGWE